MCREWKKASGAAGSVDLDAACQPVERSRKPRRARSGRTEVGHPPVGVHRPVAGVARPGEGRSASATRRRGRASPAASPRRPGTRSRAAWRRFGPPGRAPDGPRFGPPARLRNRRSRTRRASSQSSRNAWASGTSRLVNVGEPVWCSQISVGGAAAPPGGLRRRPGARRDRLPAATVGSAPRGSRTCMCAKASRNHGRGEPGTAGTQARCSPAP